MFSRDGLLAFYGWAQSSLDLLFEHCAEFRMDELQREFEGFGTKSLWDQFGQILGCEDYWLYNLTGNDWIVQWPLQCQSWKELVDLRRQVRERTLAYLHGASEEQLNTEITVTFHTGLTEVGTPAFYVHHMLTHAFHHKGQAVVQCRMLGHPTPLDTDLRYRPGWDQHKNRED